MQLWHSCKNHKNTAVQDWEKKAISFIKQTADWNKARRHEEFLSYSISVLKIFAETDLALKIAIEDRYTARISDATPSFLNGLIIDPKKVNEVFNGKINTLFLPDVRSIQTVLTEIVQAMSSAVVIPIHRGNDYDLIILGWNLPQTFNSELEAFLDIAKIRLNEIAQQSHALATHSIDAIRYAAILKQLPQAIVFVANDSMNSWVNEPAAKLLGIDIAGTLASYIISPAMGKLMSSAINKDEMNEAARALFSNPEAKLERFELLLSNSSSLHISSYNIIQGGAKGRLWIFEQAGL